MADVTYVPGGGRRIHRPIVASRVIGQMFRVWFASLPQLLLIAAIVYAPLFGLKWFLIGKTGWQRQLLIALPTIQFIAIASIGQAFAIRFVFQRLRGDPADLGRSIAIGMRRLGTVVGIDLLISAPQFLSVLLLASLASNSLVLGSRRADVGTGLWMIVGTFALIVIHLIVALVFPVAAPAAVVENRGVFAALGRSVLLTRGNRWTIFGVGFTLGLIYIVPIGVTTIVIRMMANATQQYFAQCAFDLIVASLSCVLPIVLYHELRETQEGIGIDELATVFD
jgi:hypothetical protein